MAKRNKELRRELNEQCETLERNIVKSKESPQKS